MKHLYLLFAGIFSIGAMAQVLNVQTIKTGFSSPTEITNAGDARLFIVEQSGKIRILNANNTINATPFLELTTSTISTGGERGLLGLAFHPQYATNGYFFVNYTNTAGNTVIARYSVNPTNPDLANPSSGTILMTINQPYSNHNGGTLRFGPDGYLYIGMGDGGSGGDPENRAQNINVLLGKMLRIDVNNGTPYGIPPTNPYVGIAGADEIWAIGLRNPWKFSFDELTGDLWIADVGQNEVEEINQVSSTAAGLNYGWKCYEGSEVYTAGCAVGTTTYTMPVAEYTHSGTNGCSITGGYVYHGTAYPALQGKYVFADYCLNRLGMVSNGTITYSANFTGNNNFTTFGIDVNKEMIIGSSSGTIYRVTYAPLGLEDNQSTAFTLYPNPASETVSIRTGLGYPLKMSVYDMTGKKLLENTLENENAKTDVSGLSGGIYFVAVDDASGKRHVSKLTVQ